MSDYPDCDKCAYRERWHCALHEHSINDKGYMDWVAETFGNCVSSYRAKKEGGR